MQSETWTWHTHCTRTACARRETEPSRRWTAAR